MNGQDEQRGRDGATTSAAAGEPQAHAASDLTARREALRLSLPDIAQRLRLHPRQIEALERGDWASLPGTAFVRGALRSYGRMLGIDVTPLLAQVGGAAEVLRPTSNLGQPLPRRGAFPLDGPSARRGAWLWWGLILVAAVVVLVLFFGRDGDLSQVRSWVGDGARTGASGPAAAGADPAAPGSSGVPVPPPAAVPGADGASTPGATPPPLVPLSPPGGADGAAPGAATGAGAAASLAQAGGPDAAAAGAGSGAPLRLRFAQDAWVDLRSADGKSVYTGFGRAGEQREFDVGGPVSLTVGNATQVELSWRGQPVDLRTRARDSVARLRLE